MDLRFGTTGAKRRPLVRIHYKERIANMIFDEKELTLGDKKILLRSATPEDALTLLNYIKTVCAETRFLLCEADEIKYTEKSEIEFINDKNSSENSMLIMAYVDGEYAGNCSFQPAGVSRRSNHRTDIGIALFQKYTGFGLGRLMLEQLLSVIEEAGYEQAELTVVGGNDRAYHLYESLGFRECGRVPNANKYEDGTYSDDIHMVKVF